MERNNSPSICKYSSAVVNHASLGEGMKYSTVNSFRSSTLTASSLTIRGSDFMQNSSCFHIIQIMQTPTPEKENLTLGRSMRVFPLNYLSPWVSAEVWVLVEWKNGLWARWWSWKKHKFCIINSKYISLPFIYKLRFSCCAVSFERKIYVTWYRGRRGLYGKFIM